MNPQDGSNGGEVVRLEERGAGVARITIDRPEALNAINDSVLSGLERAAATLKERGDEIRAVVLTGAGKAFVAGADIKHMVDFDADQAQAFAARGHEVMDRLVALPQITLAAINGYALGGGLELALTCDLIFASTRARLGLPEVGLGIIPGFGGTQRLGRRAGWQAARYLVLTGAHVPAEQARQMGLVLEVFEPDALLEEVEAVARTIAAQGPLAVRRAKEVMARGSQLTLDEGNALEREAFSALFASGQPAEGMGAFVGKRDPDWTRAGG